MAVINDSRLLPHKLKMSLTRLPNVSFFCQSASIPGLSLSGVNISTPFSKYPVPGDKLEYEELTLNVIADEYIKTFIEMKEWMEGITAPQSFSQYKEYTKEKTPASDGDLFVFDSTDRPCIKISFIDLFPISIGSLELNIAVGDVSPLTFQATFQYTSYKITVGE